MSKYYRREDRLAAPGDNEQSTDTMYQKAKLGQQLRDCDTLTTAQDTFDTTTGPNHHASAKLL